MTVIAVLAFSRFLHAIGLMTLFGSSALLALIRSKPLAAAIAERLGNAMRLLSLTAFVGLSAWLPLEAATIGDGWSSALDGAMLMRIATGTGIGRVWCVRLAVALLAVLTVYRAATDRRPRRLFQVAFVSGVALGMLALSGHVAAVDGWSGGVRQAVGAAHVVAAGAWFGSLLPFFCLLNALQDPKFRRDAAAALIMFSRLGHATVAVTLLSGAANTWLILRSWPFHWHSPYQALLCVKIVLAVAMTGVAVANRYIWVPRLAARPVLAVETIRRRTVLGVALGLMVVGLVSIFGILSP